MTSTQSSPIEGIYFAASVCAVNPEAALLGSVAALFLGGGQALQQLVGFANLADNDLYVLALKIAAADG